MSYLGFTFILNAFISFDTWLQDAYPYFVVPSLNATWHSTGI